MRVLGLAASCIVFIAYSSHLLAQGLTPIEFAKDYYERRTFNESFNEGLHGWTTRNAERLSVIDWNQLPDDISEFSNNSKFLTHPSDAFPRTDEYAGKALKLSGPSAIWQYSAINGKARYHIVHCNSRKRLIPGSSGVMGFSGFGVTYYDSDWNQIEMYFERIDELKNNFGDYLPPGYTQRTLGVKIPANALHAILWLANDGENTETYADDLILLNQFVGTPLQDLTKPIGERLSQNPAETNVLVNNDLRGGASFDFPNIYDENSVRGRFIGFATDPFWYRDSASFPLHPRAVNGLLLDNSSYWQLVDLKPNHTYDLSFVYENYGQAVAGVDFFDANWNPIGKVGEPLDGIKNVVFPYGLDAARDTQRFTVPQNAVHCSAYFWLNGSEPFRQRLQVFQYTIREVPLAAE